MSETAIEHTPTNMSGALRKSRIVSDNDCTVTTIHGEGLDTKRSCFEFALLSLNVTVAERPTVTLPLKEAKSSLVIQSIHNANEVTIPRSLALTAGLIGHGYVPDGWLCGLLTLTSVADKPGYLTAFDARRIYGRSLLEDVHLAGVTSERLSRALPPSIKPQRSFEVLYVDREQLASEKQSAVIKEPRLTVALEKLSDTLEILVEPLPAPVDDLCSAGMRWLATEIR